jgi:hypothetical protein
MEVVESFCRTGQILQENDEDFFVEVIEWPKRLGVAKKAVLKRFEPTILDRRRDGFANESVGTRVFRKLAKSHPSWGLVVPRTYAEGNTWSIRRFMKGEPLLSEGAEYYDRHETNGRIGKLALLLAHLDSIEPNIDIPDDPHNSAPYDNIMVRTPHWAKFPIESGLLTQSDYDAVENLTVANKELLVPRYAHGDLMPYAHVIVRPDGRLSFIDFEHFSARKPRYYDAAYCYAQIYLKAPDTELAGMFMEKLLESADSPEHQTEQMMTVLSQRAVRLYFDADFEKLEPTDGSVTKTKELLDLSVHGSLEDLIKPPPQ